MYNILKSVSKWQKTIIVLALALSPNLVSAKVLISWYGPGFHGKCTAHQITKRNEKGRIVSHGCEKFNQYALTAAHKTLPMNTLVEIRRGDKSVIVRINDRGPYVSSRTFDVSYATAKKLGFSGVASVTYRIVSSTKTINMLAANVDENVTSESIESILQINMLQANPTSL